MALPSSGGKSQPGASHPAVPALPAPRKGFGARLGTCSCLCWTLHLLQDKAEPCQQLFAFNSFLLLRGTVPAFRCPCGTSLSPRRAPSAGVGSAAAPGLGARRVAADAAGIAAAARGTVKRRPGRAGSGAGLGGTAAAMRQCRRGHSVGEACAWAAACGGEGDVCSPQLSPAAGPNPGLPVSDSIPAVSVQALPAKPRWMKEPPAGSTSLCAGFTWKYRNPGIPCPGQLCPGKPPGSDTSGCSERDLKRVPALPGWG